MWLRDWSGEHRNPEPAQQHLRTATASRVPAGGCALPPPVAAQATQGGVEPCGTFPLPPIFSLTTVRKCLSVTVTKRSRLLSLHAVAGEKRVPVMPGSPVEVKIQSRSSPPNMPPLPPVNPGGPRPVSFTPTARKTPVTLLFPASSSVQEERFCLQKSLGMSRPSPAERVL